MNSRYQQARFVTSATATKTFPTESVAEIAFAGRSNSGKSSAINFICGQKSLARTSKTPGRTQLINFFSLPEQRFLVDLPGYGYAKAPEHAKRKWGGFIDAYLNDRSVLQGLILLMDIRHPLTNFDRIMLQWIKDTGLPVHVLLNKADKLKRGAAKNTFLTVNRELEKSNLNYSLQTFSALKRQGVQQVWKVLDVWLYD